MNERDFKSKIVEVVALLLEFYKMTDQSERRISRDVIRAIVKELTRV